METVLFMAVFAASIILSFLVGARTSQKVQRNEEIRLPSVDPLQAYREHQAEKEAQRQQSRTDIILQNIENYDGTTARQQDVPGR